VCIGNQVITKIAESQTWTKRMNKETASRTNKKQETATPESQIASRKEQRITQH